MGSELLKSYALKNTKSRQSVLRVIESSQAPMTAEEIYANAKRAGEALNLSTIYRTLSTLWEKGILLKNLSQDGKTYYQISGRRHKHSLICTVCSEVVPIEHCPLETLESDLEKRTGYRITGHNLEFCGICPKCAAKAQKSDPDKP